ncbi:MAG TPA: site-specific DNA-methyltransferase [Pirellulales bacterium]|nr:site-specific DNA-methyltransferase [Pirellulales bacterium]
MRTPDWQSPDGRIELHCCDAADLLRSLQPQSVDIAVSSPPYNTLPRDTRAYGFRRRKRRTDDGWLAKVSQQGYADQLPEEHYQTWLAWMVAEMLRVSRGLAWVNHKLRFRDGRGIHPLRYLPFDVWSEIIWDRRGSMALNCSKHAPSHEYLFGFGRPHWWSNRENTLLSVWQIPPARGCDEHPCSWPVEIPQRLIAASCPPDGVVLDPFMGRGTTGLACLALGRRFIGCDRSPAYFASARKLLMTALGQPYVAAA